MGIWECINLFDELQSDEIENESFLIKHNDHHVLSQLDVHNELISIESDFSSILFLMIIPNDNFVSLVFVNQNDDIGFIHHFYQCNICVQVLNLLLWSGASGIVLQNFETCSCGYGKVFLGLVWRDRVDLCALLLWSLGISKSGYLILINGTIYGLDHVSLSIIHLFSHLTLGCVIFTFFVSLVCWHLRCCVHHSI